MEKTSPALIVTPLSSAIPLILLVKTKAGWGVPVGSEGEDVSALISQVRSDLLHPANALEIASGFHKTLHPDSHELELTIAICNTEELRPFLDCDAWFDARFTSFEEASYIIHPSQVKVLHWCERVVPKALAGRG